MFKKYFTSLGRWEILNTFPLDLAECIVLAHINNIYKNTNIIKVDHKRQLSRVVKKGKSYVVKEFKKPGPWWILRPDARCWKNFYKLKALDMPVAEFYGWLKSKDGRGFIIMEDLGNQVLGEVLKKLSPESFERLALIKQLAELVAFTHKRGLVYGDFKLTNVMIKEGSLFLIDVDKIKQKKKVKPKDRSYNLKQIMISFPEDLTKKEFSLFIKTYAERGY